MNALRTHSPVDSSRCSRKAATRSRPRRAHLEVESLEDRITPTVYHVNSLADTLNPGPNVMTLREAIQLANTNGQAANTIDIDVPGVYKIALTGTANETDNAAGEFGITGTGNLSIVNTSGGKVVIDGGGLNRVFDVNPGTQMNPAQNTTPFTVTFQGLTITDGRASPGDLDLGSGGGIRAQGAASIVLNNDVLTGNTASADGGAIALESVNNDSIGTLTINASLIANNNAGDAGGGVESDGTGLVTINAGTVITNNTCVNQGAGVWLDAGGASLIMTDVLASHNTAETMLAGGIGNNGAGNVTLIDCTIEFNFSGGNGGGFGDGLNQGNLTVHDCLFLDNTAAGNGGAIQEGGQTTTISGTLFEGNVSGGNGGALFVNGFNVTLANDVFRHNAAVTGGALESAAVNFFAKSCSFEANRALGSNGGTGNNVGPGGGGGAVYVASSTASATFSNCLFLDNAANNGVNGLGGAIDDQAGPLSINNSQFTGNVAANSGGAVSFSGDRVNVFGSTFNNNKALGNGGAISFFSANPSTFQDDTFVGNWAGGNGGAILDSVGSLVLLADTINGNAAGNIGGGVCCFNAGSVAFTNTIVAGNTALGGGADVFSLLITDNGGNLIGFAPPGFGGGTLTGIDPKLGPLENNGGVFAGAFSDQQVVPTEALLPGSPAIGKGVATFSNRDERGFPSPAGGRSVPSIGAFEPQYAATASPNQAFVESLYEVLLNRSATSDPGTVGWVTLLNQGVSPTVLVQAIENSFEFRTYEVQAAYQRYLHRQADAGGLQAFVSFLGAGGTVEQLAAILVGSDEYFALHGGNNEGFLDAIYEDALNRAPDAGGMTGFGQALAGGMSHGQVASLVFSSAEYLADLVQFEYQGLLGRDADPSGLAGWIQSLQHGGTDQAVASFFLGLAESFAKRS